MNRKFRISVKGFVHGSSWYADLSAAMPWPTALEEHRDFVHTSYITNNLIRNKNYKWKLISKHAFINKVQIHVSTKPYFHHTISIQNSPKSQKKYAQKCVHLTITPKLLPQSWITHNCLECLCILYVMISLHWN